MSAHSIFSRQWWAVCLRGSQKVNAASLDERGAWLTEAIAHSVGGRYHKTTKGITAGAYVAEMKEEVLGKGSKARLATLMVMTGNSYFPLAPDELETGPINLEGIADHARDYPRRLSSNLYQYPVETAVSTGGSMGHAHIIVAPYFYFMSAMLRHLVAGSLFVWARAVDVEGAFAKLPLESTANGDLNVTSGRMVVTGLLNLRSAEFIGDNVIESPLYTELCEREGVQVAPKDCRMRRSYSEPVGGDRRQFVSWFDQAGRFRFTPGANRHAALAKYIDLLDILSGLGLIRDAERKNPFG